MFKELIKNNAILVIGDLMLDSYWQGNVFKISPEAPVPVFQKLSSWSVVGGAANVAANLLAAGKNVIVASVIGMDEIGSELIRLLQEMGCDCSIVLTCNQRRTIEKTRFIAQNNQQLLRVDEEEIIWLKTDEETKLISSIVGRIETVSAIILSDYMKGVLTVSLCQKVIEIARKKNIPVYCDVKDPRVEKYRGSTLIKPNKKELEILSGFAVDNNDDIKKACKLLCKKCESDYILVTLGPQGMALFIKETSDIEFIPSESKEVYDVSGAGDTVIAYLVACTSSGIKIQLSARYANKAAGIKVGKIGTATVSLKEMEYNIYNEEILNQVKYRESNKIFSLQDLLKILHNYSNKKVVFTNGCFDILHAGHVMYLQKAAEYGDILVVGVNSDASVKRLKGISRPINNIKDRLAVLSSIQCISYLVVFEEDTPENLIKAIKPNVLVKGSDYDGKFIAGADVVKEGNGEVVLIPLLENHSTTNIINNWRKNNG